METAAGSVITSLASTEADQPLSVAFSPSQPVLAMGKSNGTIEFWNPTTRQPLSSLKGHTEPVLSLAFAPDGQTLISASEDKTVRLWRVNPKDAEDFIHAHSNAVDVRGLVARRSIDGLG